MPPALRSRPSLRDSPTPAFSDGSHADSPSDAAVASRQAAVARRRPIGRRILLGGLAAPGARGVHSRCPTEAGGLERLVAGDGGALERLVGRLLEDQPQPLERNPGVALDPAGGADLDDPVDDAGGLAECGQLDPRYASSLANEVPHGQRPVAPAPAPAQLLDDPPRPVCFADPELRPLAAEPEASRRALPTGIARASRKSSR